MGGDVPKQYQLLEGRTVLSRTLEALGQHSAVAGITVVTAPGDRVFSGLDFQLDIPVDCVAGGKTRAESVLNGLRYLLAGRQAPGTQPSWVMVHDAARPCLDWASIERLLRLGMACEDGALLAMPVRDTLKRADDDERVAATLERNQVWAAQTPQLFPTARLMAALESALQSGQLPTDEASAMERVGARPLLVQGSAANIKLTWPEDMDLCAAWIKHTQHQQGGN